jgi:hypothetical protein
MKRLEQMTVVGHALLWRPRPDMLPCRLGATANDDGAVLILVDTQEEYRTLSTRKYLGVDRLFALLDDMLASMTAAAAAPGEPLDAEEIPVEPVGGHPAGFLPASDEFTTPDFDFDTEDDAEDEDEDDAEDEDIDLDEEDEDIDLDEEDEDDDLDGE